jgi:hypothetical protein
MRLLVCSLLAGLAVLAGATVGPAQAPPAPEPGSVLPPPDAPAPAARPSAAEQLETCLHELAALRKEEATLQAAAQDDELKKKVELLQKQIDTLEKLVKLLGDQVKKLPSAAAMEKVETQAATLEARSVQAARRDVELANAVDDLREHADARERYGPWLPAPLKDLFLPSGNSETALSIYGTLAVGYSKIIGDSNTSANGTTGGVPTPRPHTFGGFYYGEFTPDFFLKLNDWVLLEAEIAVGAATTTVGAFAQADFFLTDWLTVTAGRFVAPIGWYNLRINNPWVNKLPSDAPGSGPLLWQQVLPAFSLLGLQAEGSFYLGCSPIKLDYTFYVSNGLNLTPAAAGMPTLTELANLENMENTFNIITNEKAVGGRVGLWWPEVGLAGGVSAMYNGDYVRGGFEESISLYAVDLNYHKGNWDARFEYGRVHQQAGSFLGANIERQGVHAQVAYRPRDCPCKYLQNLELVYRFGYVTFPGVPAVALDLTAFATPMDVPVRRRQSEIGLNYWFSPRLVLKAAYQINDEPQFHLHDNQFIAELAWGW